MPPSTLDAGRNITRLCSTVGLLGISGTPDSQQGRERDGHRGLRTLRPQLPGGGV